MRDWLLTLILRWSTWSGQCGRSLDWNLGGLDWTCSNAVGRLRYTLTGTCSDCRSNRGEASS